MKEQFQAKFFLALLAVLSLCFIPSLSYSDESTDSKIKEQLTFGDHASNIHVYIFTDWLCPFCKQLEPELETIVPKIAKVAQLTFVDIVIHPKSANFIPYNISFAINNKSQYMKLRRALDKLSDVTDSPTEEQVIDSIKSTGVRYKKLNNSEILAAVNYFFSLIQKFKVNSTPTIIVENENTKKFKQIAGEQNMTEANILDTIDSIR